MTNYNKQNPFPSKILERKLLNKENSSRKNYHLLLDLENSSIEYKVGDAIGIFPKNQGEEVSKLLELIQEPSEEMMQDPRGLSTFSIKTFLSRKANLLKITTPLITSIFDKITTPQKKVIFANLLEDKEKKLEFIRSHDLLELLTMLKPQKLSIHDIASNLAPMLPRLYSIASSPLKHPNAVQLLISTFTHQHGQKMRPGLGSQFLCDTAEIHNTKVPIYLHPTKTFTLPSDSSVPLIMIGPGTGVAPYIGFLQERLAQKSAGKNWLFFGERNRETDFYYEDFLLNLEKNNYLKLSLAFSRDQQEKIYVQNLMEKESSELYSWIKQGASIYVCGDAKKMAKDVNEMLHRIFELEGKMPPDEAKDCVKKLRRENRYLMDVY
ncbi:MAG: hypothetical protein KAR79_05010 [Simkaniaceae bacterium]|nr:hypothetical protein [Simkaniaceae bacterium]